MAVTSESMPLQKGCHVLTIIDVRQRVTPLDQLTLLVVHRQDHPGHLAKDGRCIDGSYRSNRVQIDSDAPFLGRGSRNGDWHRWAYLGLFLAAENQVKPKRKKQQHRGPNEHSQRSSPTPLSILAPFIADHKLVALAFALLLRNASLIDTSKTLSKERQAYEIKQMSCCGSGRDRPFDHDPGRRYRSRKSNSSRREFYFKGEPRRLAVYVRRSPNTDAC
jgi:hypothetical protein